MGSPPIVLFLLGVVYVVAIVRWHIGQRPNVTGLTPSIASRRGRYARPVVPAPGRRSVDLAGPFVRDLPEGTPAQERDRGRGRGQRASAAQPARRAQAAHAHRPEGSESVPAGGGSLALALSGRTPGRHDRGRRTGRFLSDRPSWFRIPGGGADAQGHGRNSD